MAISEYFDCDEKLPDIDPTWVFRDYRFSRFSKVIFYVFHMFEEDCQQ
jgi:hypothetical protein